MEHPTPPFFKKKSTKISSDLMCKCKCKCKCNTIQHKRTWEKGSPDNTRSIFSSNLISYSCILVYVEQKLEFCLSHPAKQLINIELQDTVQANPLTNWEHLRHMLSNPKFRNRITVHDHFRSKCKWIARFNLPASLKNHRFMYRFVEAVLTWTRFNAIHASSKAFTISKENY